MARPSLHRWPTAGKGPWKACPVVVLEHSDGRQGIGPAHLSRGHRTGPDGPWAGPGPCKIVFPAR